MNLNKSTTKRWIAGIIGFIHIFVGGLIFVFGVSIQNVYVCLFALGYYLFGLSLLNKMMYWDIITRIDKLEKELK